MPRRREAAIGDVIGAAEERQRVVDGGREDRHPETIPINKTLSRRERARALQAQRQPGADLDMRQFSVPAGPAPPRGNDPPLQAAAPARAIQDAATSRTAPIGAAMRTPAGRVVSAAIAAPNARR